MANKTYSFAGLSNMKYALDFMGKVVKFESNNNIRSPTDFDVSSKLELPVPEYSEIGMKASYSQYVKDSETHALSGSISVKKVSQPEHNDTTVIQCVSRIWTSLNWLKLVMVKRF